MTVQCIRTVWRTSEELFHSNGQIQRILAPLELDADYQIERAVFNQDQHFIKDIWFDPEISDAAATLLLMKLSPNV